MKARAAKALGWKWVAGLGLAAAAQAGPAGVRGPRRDHVGRVPRAGRPPAPRRRAYPATGRDPRPPGSCARSLRGLGPRPVPGAARRALVRIHGELPGGDALVVTHGGLIYSLEIGLGAEFARIGNVEGRWIGISADRLRLGPRMELLPPQDATVPRQI